MVKSLTILNSSNVGGVKKVEVTVSNDATACTTTIDFLIQGQNHSTTVTLAANQQTPVEVTHQKSGLSFVLVTASGSMAGSSKLLDLDAASSS